MMTSIRMPRRPRRILFSLVSVFALVLISCTQNPQQTGGSASDTAIRPAIDPATVEQDTAFNQRLQMQELDYKYKQLAEDKKKAETRDNLNLEQEQQKLELGLDKNKTDLAIARLQTESQDRKTDAENGFMKTILGQGPMNALGQYFQANARSKEAEERLAQTKARDLLNQTMAERQAIADERRADTEQYEAETARAVALSNRPLSERQAIVANYKANVPKLEQGIIEREGDVNDAVAALKFLSGLPTTENGKEFQGDVQAAIRQTQDLNLDQKAEAGRIYQNLPALRSRASEEDRGRTVADFARATAADGERIAGNLSGARTLAGQLNARAQALTPENTAGIAALEGDFKVVESSIDGPMRTGATFLESVRGDAAAPLPTQQEGTLPPMAGRNGEAPTQPTGAGTPPSTTPAPEERVDLLNPSRIIADTNGGQSVSATMKGRDGKLYEIIQEDGSTYKREVRIEGTDLIRIGDKTLANVADFADGQVATMKVGDNLKSYVTTIKEDGMYRQEIETDSTGKIKIDATTGKPITIGDPVKFESKDIAPDVDKVVGEHINNPGFVIVDDAKKAVDEAKPGEKPGSTSDAPPAGNETKTPTASAEAPKPTAEAPAPLPPTPPTVSGGAGTAATPNYFEKDGKIYNFKGMVNFFGPKPIITEVTDPEEIAKARSLLEQQGQIAAGGNAPAGASPPTTPAAPLQQYTGAVICTNTQTGNLLLAENGKTPADCSNVTTGLDGPAQQKVSKVISEANDVSDLLKIIADGSVVNASDADRAKLLAAIDARKKELTGRLNGFSGNEDDLANLKRLRDGIDIIYADLRARAEKTENVYDLIKLLQESNGKLITSTTVSSKTPRPATSTPQANAGGGSTQMRWQDTPAALAKANFSPTPGRETCSMLDSECPSNFGSQALAFGAGSGASSSRPQTGGPENCDPLTNPGACT